MKRPCCPDCSCYAGLPSPLWLDLGSGPTPLDGHLGFDRFDAPPSDTHAGVWHVDLDLGMKWPLVDESVDALYSSHLIEHLHAGTTNGKDVLAHFFEEAWRIAKPLAPFVLRWPSLVDEETGLILASVFYDPTHRRFIPRQQLLYFSSEGRRTLGVEQYGFECNWTLLGVGQRALTADRSILEYEARLRKDPMP